MNDYSALLGGVSKDLIDIPVVSLDFFKYANIKEGKFIYGEYPKTLVTDTKLCDELNEALVDDTLISTGRAYFVSDDWSRKEYIYKGQKYISFVSNLNKYYDGDEEIQFPSNLSSIEDRKTYWIRVEPIEWTVKGNVAVAYGNLLPVEMLDDFYKKVKLARSEKISENIEPIVGHRSR